MIICSCNFTTRDEKARLRINFWNTGHEFAQVIGNPDMQKSANERKRSYMQRGGNQTSLVARYLSQLKMVNGTSHFQW
jgi:hypothetical protein